MFIKVARAGAFIVDTEFVLCSLSRVSCTELCCFGRSAVGACLPQQLLTAILLPSGPFTVILCRTIIVVTAAVI
jgi:hypothetical protein